MCCVCAGIGGRAGPHKGGGGTHNSRGGHYRGKRNPKGQEDPERAGGSRADRRGPVGTGGSHRGRRGSAGAVKSHRGKRAPQGQEKHRGRRGPALSRLLSALPWACQYIILMPNSSQSLFGHLVKIC